MIEVTCPGQGFVMTNIPEASCSFTTEPVCASNNANSIPKNGNVALPGFKAIAPGNGVTTIPPLNLINK